jgi:predicted lipoprotein with Yx(FWY)xxD motif
MNRTYVLGGILAAAVLAAGGLGIGAVLSSPAGAATAASATSGAPMSGASVGTAALAPGTALVDGSGRALYLFEADQSAMSACTGVCAQIWPPALTTGAAPVVSGAAQAQLLGSTVRADGSHQVTYDGHPLYAFNGDKKPGDAKGQGINRFGGLWYVVAPSGSAITASPAAPAAPAAAPAPSGATGAYGY